RRHPARVPPRELVRPRPRLPLARLRLPRRLRLPPQRHPQRPDHRAEVQLLTRTRTGYPDRLLIRVRRHERPIAMWMLIAPAVLAGGVIVGVTVLSGRYPKWAGFLLTLPLVSILAFMNVWLQRRDLQTISQVARETLVLVPLGLPFFVPLAWAERWGLSFWPA